MDPIPIAKPTLDNSERKLLLEAFDSGWISSKGKFIEEFETNFSRYCNSKYGIALMNGTVALHLAFKTLEISHKDEIIAPTFTFIASASSIKHAGATPIFIDSNPKHWGIDVEKIEEKITPRTKAILPVHIYGHPCDMGYINDIASDHDLFVIEDAAEAHGAEYKRKKVGSLSDISCFSFFGNKIITTGEGGMCLTNNDELAEKMKILRDHGMDPKRKYWHPLIGFNYRMTNLQAAIGVSQLKKIDSFLKERKVIAKRYTEGIESITDITTRMDEDWASTVNWIFPIIVKNREKVFEFLNKSNIESRPFFNPIHQMPPYKTEGVFDVADRLSKHGLNLPTFIGLTEEDIKRVLNALKESAR